MTDTYLDRIPNELLDKILAYFSPTEILTCWSASSKVRMRYLENPNNECWSQLMKTKYHGKYLTIRDQVIQQHDDDVHLMQEYREFVRRCRLGHIFHYQLPGTRITNDDKNLINSGFLLRYPYLADKLFELILSNLEKHFFDHEVSGETLQHMQMLNTNMRTEYSSMSLACINRRIDIISYLLQKDLTYDLFSKFGSPGATMFHYMHLTMQFGHFDLLPIFEPYYLQIIKHLHETINHTKSCFNRPLTSNDVASVMLFLTKSIKIIESIDDPEMNISRFIYLFMHHFLYSINNYNQKFDLSYEPIFIFCYQAIQDSIKDLPNMNVLYDIGRLFLSQHNLMTFDKLVQIIYSDNRYLESMNILIRNEHRYPEEQNAQRIQFILDLGVYQRTDKNSALIDALVLSSINNNTPLITDCFCKYWSISNQTYSNCGPLIISFDMMTVLVKYQITIVSSALTYDIEDSKQIESWYQLFRVMKAYSKLDMLNVATFIQLFRLILSLDMLHSLPHSKTCIMLFPEYRDEIVTINNELAQLAKSILLRDKK
jgi:hypothetical protein